VRQHELRARPAATLGLARIGAAGAPARVVGPTPARMAPVAAMTSAAPSRDPTWSKIQSMSSPGPEMKPSSDREAWI
jgi:hypothetical protein